MGSDLWRKFSTLKDLKAVWETYEEQLINYIWKFVEHLKSGVMEMKISWRNFIANFNLGFPQQEKGWNETIWPSLCRDETLSRAYRQWCTMGLPGNWMSWWIVRGIGKEKLCSPLECLIPLWYHSFLKHLCFTVNKVWKIVWNCMSQYQCYLIEDE